MTASLSLKEKAKISRPKRKEKKKSILDLNNMESGCQKASSPWYKSYLISPAVRSFPSEQSELLTMTEPRCKQPGILSRKPTFHPRPPNRDLQKSQGKPDPTVLPTSLSTQTRIRDQNRPNLQKNFKMWNQKLQATGDFIKKAHFLRGSYSPANIIVDANMYSRPKKITIEKQISKCE